MASLFTCSLALGKLPRTLAGSAERELAPNPHGRACLLHLGGMAPLLTMGKGELT